MKPYIFVFMAVIFIIIFSPCVSIAEESTSEEYVYAIKIEGGKLYRLTHRTDGDKKQTDKKEVRRMEIIYPDTILDIEKGASVSLTCCGGKVVNLEPKDKDIRYTVKMSDFKKDSSIPVVLVKKFFDVLKRYAKPGSVPGQKVHIRVRGISECKNILPSDYAKIMMTEDPVTFLLKQEGTSFSLIIKESDSNKTIYSKEATSNRIDVPIETFIPGKTYEWFTRNIKTGVRRNANFTLLSKDESKRIIKSLNDITSLLPAEADAETRYRFQAGYLISEGLEYDAWRLLYRNGVL